MKHLSRATGRAVTLPGDLAIAANRVSMVDDR